MSASKRYINKEDVLYYLKNDNIDSVVREIKINTLFKADMLVLDMWSSKFYNELNPKERIIRKQLSDKYQVSSSFQFIRDEDYTKLSSMSEALISLINNNAPWIDIHVVIDKLKIVPTNEEAGRFDLLRKKCIDAVIEYFK